MDSLYDENGKKYDPNTVLDNLHTMWRNRQQLSYSEFKLLWEIVGHLREELKGFHEMELEGRNRSEYD